MSGNNSEFAQKLILGKSGTDTEMQLHAEKQPLVFCIPCISFHDENDDDENSNHFHFPPYLLSHSDKVLVVGELLITRDFFLTS